MNSRRDLLRWMTGTLGGLTVGERGVAQEGRTRRLIVPHEPGGGIDAMARLLSLALAGETGVNWMVLNVSGASGNLGTAQAARAEPNGETLLVTGSGHLTSPLLLPNAGFDPLDDFTPLLRLAVAPVVMLAHESLRGVVQPGPQGLRALLRRELAFASGGFGATSHLGPEQIKALTGAPWQHVPYKGTAPALRALISGEVQLGFLPISSATTALASRKVFPVAVAHRTRLHSLPQVPTLAQLGITQGDCQQWYGVFMPRNGQEPVPDGLLQELLRAVRSSAFLAGLKRLELEPGLLMPKEFTAFLNAEMTRNKQFLSTHAVDRPNT